MANIDTALEALGLVPTAEIDTFDDSILALSHNLLTNIPLKHTASTTKVFWDSNTPEQIGSYQAQWAAPVLMGILSSETPPDADFFFALPDPRKLPRKILQVVSLVYVISLVYQRDNTRVSDLSNLIVRMMMGQQIGFEMSGAYQRVRHYKEPVNISDVSQLLRPRLHSGDKILAMGTLLMCEKQASVPQPLFAWTQLIESVFTHTFWAFRVANGSSLEEGPWSYSSSISPWSAEYITWDGLCGHSPMFEGVGTTVLSATDWAIVKELARQRQAAVNKRVEDKIKLAKEYLELEKDGKINLGDNTADNKAVNDLLVWAAGARKQARKELAREYRQLEEAGEIDSSDNIKVKKTLDFLDKVEENGRRTGARRKKEAKLAAEYLMLKEEGVFVHGDNNGADDLIKRVDTRRRDARAGSLAFQDRAKVKGKIAREFLKQEAAGEVQRGDNKEVDELVAWWESS